MAQIAVIGAGYVGLTTAACFSHLGHDVVCADIDDGQGRAARRGARCPILEAGLDDLVARGPRRRAAALRRRAPRRRRATAEFVYLCVPTPQGDDGSADLSYIEAAAREIGPVLPAEAVVINKSTVPVGSTRVGRAGARAATTWSWCPTPSSSARARRCTTSSTPTASSSAATTRRPPCGWRRSTSASTAPLIVTDPASAETIKYASNAFLATKISFVNAIAAVCEAVGADVNDVVLGMGYDKRIGHEFLKPGPGWGGSCFPKDSRALVRIAEDAGYDFDLLRGVIAVNDEQFERVAAKVARAWSGGSLEGVKVGRLGPHVQGPHRRPPRLAGRRASSALLAEQGAEVRAYDPAVKGAASAGHRAAPPTPTRRARAPTCWSCSPSGTSSAGSTSTRSPG